MLGARLHGRGAPPQTPRAGLHERGAPPQTPRAPPQTPRPPGPGSMREGPLPRPPWAGLHGRGAPPQTGRGPAPRGSCGPEPASGGSWGSGTCSLAPRFLEGLALLGEPAHPTSLHPRQGPDSELLKAPH
ncbi:unnamed protein product [Arctogadus glacialis]